MDDTELIDIQWETTVSHRAKLTRAQVREMLGHTVEELGHRPIIDEYLYPGEEDMDDSRYELAEALGRLETDPGEVNARMITSVDPDS
jgi:hypothetical protein